MKDHANMKDHKKMPIIGDHYAFSLKGNPDKSVFPLIKRYIRQGDMQAFRELLRTGILLDYKSKQNVIATVGKAVYTEIMSVGSGATYTGEITDGALGTGSSPSFTAGDTSLNNEVGRKVASDAAYDDNICYVDFFFDTNDIADDTYTEWGTFIDGDGSSAGSGQAFSLLATNGWVKSGSIYISSRYKLV